MTLQTVVSSVVVAKNKADEFIILCCFWEIPMNSSKRSAQNQLDENAKACIIMQVLCLCVTFPIIIFVGHILAKSHITQR